ncbi:MAG: phosphopantetheine-binding protein [Syntrophales bacterium]
MDEKKIYEEFVNILRVYAKNPEELEKATKDTHILNDLKVNSARLVDVIIKCEDTFDISIEDDEADQIRTIGDALEIISGKLNGAN